MLKSHVAGSLFAAAIVAGLAAAAWAVETPDISSLPTHPRLLIGGVPTAAGYVDPMKLEERAKTHEAEYRLLNSSSSSIMARALSAMMTQDREKLAGVARELQATKSVGARLADDAIAFDWIASELSDADRAAIARHLGDLASGSQASWTNAYHNIHLSHELGAGVAALAIAGDDPRAAEIFAKAQAVFAEFMNITGDGLEATPENMHGRAAWGGGWPEAHDYDRHGSRYAMIYFLALRSATGADVFTGSRFWQAKPLFHIYTVLPNGRNILPFDDDDNPYLHRFDREVMLVLAREYKDPHARWYLNHVYTEAESPSAAWNFLYNEREWPEHDFSDLPKAHYIPGNGMVYARSGWGNNDTYVAFKSADWFTYHQNNSQNVFAIYRNAPLAVKDGVYAGTVVPHFVNYTIRTISYNGITVIDPTETYKGPDMVPDVANDGGQVIQQWSGDPHSLEMWKGQADRTSGARRDTVDWLAFESTDDYAYAAAEAGRAYRPGKVPFFSRQFVFVYPNWVVVFDRVTAGSAEFAKTFHLHAPEEMEVSGSKAVVTTKTTNHTTIPGRLFVESLLPKDADVKRVDGLAMVNGTSWTGIEPYNDQFLCPHHLEITAPKEKETFFLTAMYACDADVESAPKAEVVEETPQKVTISLEGRYTITFNKTGEVGWKMAR